ETVRERRVQDVPRGTAQPGFEQQGEGEAEPAQARHHLQGPQRQPVHAQLVAQGEVVQPGGAPATSAGHGMAGPSQESKIGSAEVSVVTSDFSSGRWMRTLRM